MKLPSNLKKLSVIIGALYATTSMAAIEEVIVTAQKRQESQQDVPIAIQAFSADTIKDLGITNTDDLGVITPGLQIAQSGAAGVVFIRGLGNQDGSGGQEGSVATYVDGVWHGSVTGGSLSFNNIERIEVLKGPQGTLFGRNTSGGVISITTKDPSDEASTSVGISYGNYDTASASFYANRALSENLFADIAIYGSNQGEGYGENLFNGHEIAKKEDELFVRTKWKYVGDTSSVTFAYSSEQYKDDQGLARYLPEGSRGIAGELPLSDLHDTFWDGTDSAADFEHETISLRIENEFENFDFLSITAYKHDDLTFLVDNDSTQFAIFDLLAHFDTEYITQEFQFLSNDPDAKMQWIGGLFFMDQAALGTYRLSGPFAGPGLDGIDFGGTIDTTSVAVFGEVKFDTSENGSLTVGLRYTRDKREVEGYNRAWLNPGNVATWQGYFTGAPTPKTPTTPQSETFSEPTWRIVYDHQLTDDMMAYVSYNRGFRSGNYNTVAPGDPAFEPELVDAFEIGVKSDWFDNTLRLNASIYHYEVDDLQFQSLQGTVARVENAASAVIDGIELDIIWQATDALTLSLGTSYMDGEYDEFPTATSNVPNVSGFGNQGATVQIDAGGNELAGAPESVTTIGATYLIPTDSGDFDITARATYNSGFPWEPDGRLEQDDYTLVTLSAGWRSADGHWTVRAVGKNLTDEDYALFTRSQTGVTDISGSAAPRTYNVSVTYDF